MAAETAASTASPARWPWVTLTALKWSMSAMATASGACVRAARVTSTAASRYQAPAFSSPVLASVRAAAAGRVRKGQQSDLRRSGQYFTHLRDERRIDVVEQLIPLAGQAGMSLTLLAMAFAITHPCVTAAILGPRTMEHLDDLLAGAEVVLSDDILDRIDAIVPAGTDVGQLDMAYQPPAVVEPALRRRPIGERTAA